MFEIIENKHPYFVLVAVLVVGNILFGWSYFSVSKELQTIENKQAQMELNDKVLDFSSLFIKEVLKADKEVNFEIRLSLENAVRDLKDEEIMAHWQKFVASKTEAEAQLSVKNLLGVLVSKIKQ